MKQFTYTITDPVGIHARPAGLLVKEAQKFTCDVKLSANEKEVDLKRLFAVMGMGVKQNAVVTITADGVDEVTAIAELEAFFCEHL